MGYNDPNRLSKLKTKRCSYHLKQQLSPGKVPLSSQLQGSVSSTETKCQEPSASSVRTHSPFIWSVTSRSRAMSECPRLNGGKASDWLRLCRMTRGWCSIKRRCSITTLQLHERYPFRALRLLVPSRLEGMWGIVDRKAGGLADARHIYTKGIMLL